MDDLSTFWQVLIGICAGCLSIWGVVKAIVEIRRMVGKPTDALMDKLSRIEDAVDEHKRMLDNDNRRLDAQDESQRLLLGGMLQLMNHELDGNHTKQLGEQRQKIEDYLIRRGSST